MINIPAPQQQQRAELRPNPNTRVQMPKAPQIGTGFLDILSQRVDSEAKLKLQQRARNLKYIRDKASNEADTLAIMAKAEVVGLRGEEADKKRDEIQRNLGQKIDAMFSDKFSSIDPEAKQMLEIVKGDKITSYQKTAIPHSYNQMNDVKLKASAQVVKNLAEKTIEFSSNPDEFSNGLKAVKLQAQEDAVLNFGGDSAEAKRVGLAYIDKTASETILGAIKVQATNGAVEDANRIFKSYEGELLEQDKIKALRELNKADNQRGTNVAVSLEQEARSLYGDDEQKIYAHIEQNAPDTPNKGDIIRQGKAMSDVNSSMKRRADKEVEQSQFRKGVELIDQRILEGKNITVNDINNVDNPAHKIRLLNYAKNAVNGTLTDNDATVSYLRDAYRDNSLKDIDLNQFKDQLTPSKLSKFETMQKSLITGEKSQEVRVQNQSFKKYYDVVDRFIRLKDDEFYGMGEENYLTDEQKNKLYDISEDMFDQLQDRKGMTELEIRRRLKKALNDQAITFTDTNRFNPFNSDEAKIAEKLILDEDNPAAATTEVDSSWSDAIQARALESKGKALTPAQLEAALRRLKSKGIDLTKKAGTR